MLVYADDDNYIKLGSVAIFETRQTEFGKEVGPGMTLYPTYGNAVIGPPAIGPTYGLCDGLNQAARSATPLTPATTDNIGSGAVPGRISWAVLQNSGWSPWLGEATQRISTTCELPGRCPC